MLWNKEGLMPKKEDLIYFLSLELENVRCFGSPAQLLNLSNKHNNPARWTLLLGDNSFGKTTVLQCLAWSKFVPSTPPDGTKSMNNPDDKITKGPMESSLPEEENDVIEELIRVGCNQLGINAQFVQGIKLDTNSKKNPSSNSIRTEIKVNFKNDGKLEEFVIEPEKNSSVSDLLNSTYEEPFILVYGANRIKGKLSIQGEQDSESETSDRISSRLSDITELYDAEEILTYLDYKALKSRAVADKQIKATPDEQRLIMFKKLVADILPDDNIKAKDIHIYGPPKGVCLDTFSGKDIPFSSLSLGYQTTIRLIIDLAWRLSERYPESAKPFAEPAIVLIDEIDLHLHPIWQRKFIDQIVESLNGFSNSQFIVTTHSPLIVQSAAARQDASIVVCRREADHVVIDQSVEAVKNWRADQILTSDLFGLETARPKKIEELLKEKEDILSKPKLTKKDETRLKVLDDEIGFLPVSESHEDNEAMEIIRKAANWLITKAE